MSARRSGAAAKWLIKSEPSVYAYEQLVSDGRTRWDGVRNFEARNNLRAMKVGDLALYYHSNEGKAVVGVAKIVKEAYDDPTVDDEDGARGEWSCVDVAPVKQLAEPVTLATIKATKELAEMALLRRSRISVVPVTDGEFARVLQLGKTKL